MRKFQILALIFFLSTLALVLNKYVEHGELHNEWEVIYGDSNYFIESRVNLYKVRGIIKNSDLAFRDAIWEQFKKQIKSHSFINIPPIDTETCSIENIFGNLHTGILIQVRCNSGNEN